jgi:CheY-like chemotaxis protein
MMPEMTGIEFHDRVAAHHPRMLERIVFITGGAFTASARAFLDRVPNECVDKPFDVGALRATVERFRQ